MVKLVRKVKDCTIDRDAFSKISDMESSHRQPSRFLVGSSLKGMTWREGAFLSFFSSA